MKIGQELFGFELKQVKAFPDARVTAYFFEHGASGARLLRLHAPEDVENCFCVIAPTPPPDDTGLPHIMEHSLLAGSRKFPVKEPFFEMVKISMATFINAMTSQAMTVYPVASAVHKDFLFDAVDGVIKGDLHVVAQVVAMLGAAALTAAAKEILEDAAAHAAEDLAKNIERIVKAAPLLAGRSRSGTAARGERRVAILIVGSAFLRVGKHLVGFAEFLELFLRSLVAGVFVRVIFDGQLAVGLLDVLDAGIVRDAQHFVVIVEGGHVQVALD